MKTKDDGRSVTPPTPLSPRTPITPLTPLTPATPASRKHFKSRSSSSDQVDFFQKYVVGVNKYNFPEVEASKESQRSSRHRNPAKSRSHHGSHVESYSDNILDNRHGGRHESRHGSRQGSRRGSLPENRHIFTNDNYSHNGTSAYQSSLPSMSEYNSARQSETNKLSLRHEQTTEVVPVAMNSKRHLLVTLLCCCCPCFIKRNQKNEGQLNRFSSTIRKGDNETYPTDAENPSKKKKRKCMVLYCSFTTCCLIFILSILALLGAIIIAALLFVGISTRQMENVMKERSDILNFSMKQLSQLKKGDSLDEYPFDLFKTEWNHYVETSSISDFILLIESSFKDIYSLSLEKSIGQATIESQLLQQLYGVVSELDWFVGGEIIERSTFDGTPTLVTALAAQQHFYYLLEQEIYLSNMLSQLGMAAPPGNALLFREKGRDLLTVDRASNPTFTLASDEWNVPVRSYLEFLNQQVAQQGIGVPLVTIAFYSLSIIPFGILACGFVLLLLCCGIGFFFVRCIQRRSSSRVESVIYVLNILKEWDFGNPAIHAMLSIPKSKATDLEISLQKLIHRLEEIKPYLSNILETEDEEPRERQRTYSIHSSLSSLASIVDNDELRDSFSENPSINSPRNRKSVFSHVSSKSKMSARALRSQKRTFALGSKDTSELIEKDATLMMITFPYLHDWIDGHDIETLSVRYNNILCLILDIVRQEKGVVHFVFDNKILVSFGCSSRVFLPENHACQSALSIARASRKKFEKYGLKVHIGITSGKIYCGKVGNRNFKTVSCVGSIVTRLTRLCQLNDHYSSDILLDIETYSASQTHFVSRIVDYINILGLPGDDSQIYELIDNKTVRETEWMYQLSESEEQERYKNFHNAWSLVLQNNFEEAKKSYEKILSDEANILSRSCLLRLQKIIETGLSKPEAWSYIARIIPIRVTSNVEGKGKTNEVERVISSSSILRQNISQADLASPGTNTSGTPTPLPPHNPNLQSNFDNQQQRLLSSNSFPHHEIVLDDTSSLNHARSRPIVISTTDPFENFIPHQPQEAKRRESSVSTSSNFLAVDERKVLKLLPIQRHSNQNK